MKIDYEETIKYNDWKTGEERERDLSNAHPAEHKTNLVCPFDNTPIIRWYNEIDKGYECPNCGTEYRIEFKTQEDVNKYAEKHFNQLQEKLAELEEEKNKPEKMVNHADDQGIIQRDLFSKFRGSSLFPNSGTNTKE